MARRMIPATQDLDRVLGSLIKVRLIRALNRLSLPVSGRHAARLAGVSAKAIQSLDELAALGILNKRVATGQHLYAFNHEHYLAHSIAELFAAEERKLTQLMAFLRSALENISTPMTGAIFGSTSRREARPESDLDVLVIVEQDAHIDPALDALLNAAPVLLRRFGAKLSPIVLTHQEWRHRVENDDEFAQATKRDALVFAGRPLDDLGAND